MISVKAPGKLFIAGEYAVVEPGEPSVLIAVNRFLTVMLTESVDHGSIRSSQYGQLPVVWTRDEHGLVVDLEHHPYDYVLSAITVVERLRAERSIPPRFFDLRIESELDDASGRKFGLGSSAAVTVATVRALDEFYRLGLTRLEIFELSLLATIKLAPTSSGGDLAASTFGGWLAYSAPDRALLRRRLDAGTPIAALIAEPWPGLSLRRLRPPAGLTLLVGWTGTPASTERLVDGLQHRKRNRAGTYPEFLQHSRACVGSLVEALDTGDDALALASIRRARTLLQRLGRDSRVGIETAALEALCDAAEAAGAAAKSSGAGGGDCGIVLAPAGADLAAIEERWSEHGIRRLPLSVHAPEGSVDLA